MIRLFFCSNTIWLISIVDSGSIDFNELKQQQKLKTLYTILQVQLSLRDSRFKLMTMDKDF